MASIRKRKGSKFLTACYRGADGRRMQVTTKETNRGRALRIALALEDAAQNRSSRAALLQHFNRISEELYSQPIKHESVRAYFEATLRQRGGEIAATSLRRYSHVAKTFMEHLGPAAEMAMSDVTVRQITDSRTIVAERTSSGNANAYLKCLRVFFTRAVSERTILEDPTRLVRPLVRERKPASEKRRPFTSDELSALISAARSEPSREWLWMIIIGVLTGQRLGDVASMHWKALTYVSSDLAVWEFESNKTDRPTIDPLPRKVAEEMARELETGSPGANGWVFPHAHEIYCVSGRTNTLSNQFARLMAMAGVQEERTHKPRKNGRDRSRSTSVLGFHSLRHTATSVLSNAGVPRNVIMDIVGHDTVAMSLRYTHTELSAKVAAQAKLIGALQPLSEIVPGAGNTK